MSTLDETIRLAGRAVTLIRSGGNVSTYMYYTTTGRVAGKSKLNLADDHEGGFLFPSDSSVVAGDLVLAGTDYYLVVALADIVVFGEAWGYKGMLYKCNSVITVQHWNSVTDLFEDYKADVHSFIIHEGEQAWAEDKSLLRPTKYRGKRKPFTLYAQTSSGINSNSVIIDQELRKFRVSKDHDPFAADGILITQVLWVE